MKTDLRAFFERGRADVDRTLDRLLPADTEGPPGIHSAMRHSVFAGGKRLRPLLCLAGYSLVQKDWEAVLPIASAIEMAHTYSLIHDDLPAMDDDDFRRGAPSCHRKFGEAIAILAGDALLTLSFETIADCSPFEPGKLAKATVRFARALGTRQGMIAGQVLDLAAEGCRVDRNGVDAIHQAKTGALLAASIWMGAYLGGASETDMGAVEEYGRRIGLAFQIVDDILDETESREILGKTAGKDRERQKATYPAAIGVEESRGVVETLTQQAREAARAIRGGAGILSDIADYLEIRGN